MQSFVFFYNLFLITLQQRTLILFPEIDNSFLIIMYSSKNDPIFGPSYITGHPSHHHLLP